MSEIDIEAVIKFTDLELLKEYKRVANRLLDLKDEELCFLADHPNRDFWDNEQEEEYDELLEDIGNCEKDIFTLNKIIDKRK